MEDIDNYKNIPFLPTGSTVAVQWEDGRLWMHGTIIGHRSDGQNGGNYKIRVTEMGCTIIRTKRHPYQKMTIREMSIMSQPTINKKQI